MKDSQKAEKTFKYSEDSQKDCQKAERQSDSQKTVK